MKDINQRYMKEDALIQIARAYETARELPPSRCLERLAAQIENDVLPDTVVMLYAGKHPVEILYSCTDKA